jgi:hypothetical protein
VSETRMPLTPAPRAGVADTEDELTRMLRAVERIAEGVDGITELAVRLAPNTSSPAPAALRSHEQVALVRLRADIRRAQVELAGYVLLPLGVAECLANAIARLTVKS